ncbi:unnamed protein product [Diplocarpon coronariae]
MTSGLKLALGAHVAAHILLHAALLTPPSVLSRVRLATLALPAIWALHLHTWNLGLGYVAAVHALWATELLLFRNPRQDFAVLHSGDPSRPPTEDRKTSASVHRRDDKVDEALENITAAIDETKARARAKSVANGSHRIAWAEPYPQDLWNRFLWVSKLVLSLRYIGWSTSPSQTVLYSSQPPLGSAKSRASFVRQQLFHIGLCIGIMDVANFYQYFDPYFQIDTSIDENFPRRLAGFFARNHLSFLSPRFVRISCLMLQQYSVLSLVGAIPAVLFVSLGALGLVGDFWGRVESWPSIMGSPLAIAHRGLRGLWGATWHQLFRNILVGPGRAVARVLKLPEHSTAAYAIRVAVAFAISSALHSATLPSGVPGISPLRYASFFWVQGACVLYEMALVKAAGRLGLMGPRPDWLELALALARTVWTGFVLYHTVPVVEDELTRKVVRRPELKAYSMGLKSRFILSFQSGVEILESCLIV